MAKLLTGREAAAALTAAGKERAAALVRRGITPKLVLLRCGDAPADLAYERGALSRSEKTGVTVEVRALPADVTREVLLAQLDAVNGDPAIHGCLLLRPLPPHLRPWEQEICDRLSPEKDVDGMTAASAAALYLGRPRGFAPCTAEACLALLDHYGVECAGKRAVVLGRSPVVGRPVAMLLLARNATVTVCHTATRDLPRITKEADILVSAAGRLGCLTAAHVRAGQTVLDVSMNWDAARGCMAGDADFDAVASIVDAITPVPNGVGAVTSSVLMHHVLTAAERAAEEGSL